MAAAAAAPVRLRCEYFTNPMAIDVPDPRLSWELSDPRQGARQSAYRVLVAGSIEALRAGAGDVWDSGQVASDQSIHVAYAGPALASRRRCWWTVQVWDANGQPSPWAEPAFWEMGLLSRAQWGAAQWVGSSLVGGPKTTSPCPYLRSAIDLKGPISSARLYVTALGVYEFHLNGQRVGDDVFNPGWTEYKKRVQYQAYDVTPLLRPGANVMGAILGDGWYCGHLEWRDRQRYGDRPRLLAQLVVEYEGGVRETFVTDAGWRTSAGPILGSDMIMGETHDARREMPGWDAPGFDDRRWVAAEVFADPGIALVAQRGPTVRRVEELRPVGPPLERGSTWNVHRWVYDLGQNMVGRVRLRVSGKAGQTITLRYAEVLKPDGSVYTDNLRSAKQTDHYTLRGDGEEVWEPKFTFHGFRYVEVTGLGAEEPPRDLVTGIVIHSDYERTGEFECSDPLVNQLQRNIWWGWRGNSVDIPTDCPQRDERLGWTGDAQVFVRTACFNADVAAFFTKWQQDLADAQGPNGTVPCIVPDTELGTKEADGGPAWADALLICPWTIYQCYGDARLLERNFERFERYVAACGARAIDFIKEHPDNTKWGGFGDWLALDGSGKTDGGTPKDLIGTAFYAHAAQLVADMARVLNRPDDARKYDELFARVRQAFRDRYVTKAGLIAGATQTAYVLALHFDLAPDDLRPAMVKELVRDIEKRGNKLSTGFVGSPYLPHVLSANGRLDVAYRLLFQKDWPSYLYAVTQGTTTIWERWDGWTHDKGYQDPGMNSFNHYAYGAIGAWLYAVVAGIELDPARPAFKHGIIRPQPGPGLTHARGRLRTPYGLLESAWRIEGATLTLEVTVPPNTTATVHIPTPDPSSARSENLRPTTPAVFEVEAGRYVFTAKAPTADAAARSRL